MTDTTNTVVVADTVGVIRDNTSVFASLVVMVKKKMVFGDFVWIIFSLTNWQLK